VLLLLWCFVGQAWASHPPEPVETTKDVIGCWERIDFSEEAQKKINEIEPWPIRYQWYCFEPDGTLYTHGSTRYSKHTSKSLREIFARLPKEITYTLLQKGVIRTDHMSVKQTLTWGASFTAATVSFDGKIIEKGTLIMALYDQQKKRNVYFRYLRKLQ
jgi:hypothetical protein